MGLNQIVDESRLYVRERLKFNHRSHSNVFEVTIRVLGSLLSMHHLTGDELYLSRAQELADKMLPAFNTPNGVPLASLDFSTGAAVAAPDLGSSTSEATTLQLEWRYLAVLTGETKYWRAAERVMDSIAKSTPASGRVDGLVPIYISTTGDQDHLFVGTNYRLGSRGDSYYEYLAKQWLQTGRAEDRYRQMFEQAMDGMLKRLRPSGWEFIGELQHGIDGGLTPKMDHLVCFLPGTLALFVSHGKRLSAQEISKLPEKHREYLRFAQSLLETCYQTYRVTATGLAPEIVYFNMNDNGGSEDIIIHNMDGHNILRPETVESLFYLYRITGNQTYRQWGWEMFQNFEKHCKVPDGGYSSLRDVRQSPPEMSDKMESFWVGETLKYFYLLFDDDAKLPLDKYLINTEAHPLPILDEIPAEFLKKLQAEGLGRFAPR
jgi:mannosyl-oligosaccharide alpha-1,2-mannosidase